MSFYKTDSENKIIRNRVTLECPEDVITEQNHKSEVDINNIVKKHGMDLIQKVAALQQFEFDDVTGNDFQESMNAIIKARDTFSQVPSKIRKEFDNDPAKFMDFVHNPDNSDQLIQWGLKEAPTPEPPPVKVEITNSETPAVTPPAE